MLNEYTEKNHDKMNTVLGKIKDVLNNSARQIEEVIEQFKRDIPIGTWIKVTKGKATYYIRIQDLEINKKYKAKAKINKSILINKFGISMRDGLETVELDLSKEIISISNEDLIKELSEVHVKNFLCS